MATRGDMRSPAAAPAAHLHPLQLSAPNTRNLASDLGAAASHASARNGREGLRPYLRILLMEETEGAVELVQTLSEISFSRISHAKMVGFSRLYCSILFTTCGVATFGFEPPIMPGGRMVPGGGRGRKLSYCYRRLVFASHFAFKHYAKEYPNL